MWQCYIQIFTSMSVMPHMPSDYPVYYDALYFPKFHPSVFETPDCCWLTEAVTDHLCLYLIFSKKIIAPVTNYSHL